MQESKYRPACRDAGSLQALQATTFERVDATCGQKRLSAAFLLTCVLANYFGTNTFGYSSLCANSLAENKAVILSPLTGGFSFVIYLGSQIFASTLM
jgi:hypothetical protein